MYPLPGPELTPGQVPLTAYPLLLLWGCSPRALATGLLEGGQGPDMRCWEASPLSREWASRPTSFGLFPLSFWSLSSFRRQALMTWRTGLCKDGEPSGWTLSQKDQGLHRKGAALGWPTCLEGKAGSQSGSGRPCPIFPCLGQAPSRGAVKPEFIWRKDRGTKSRAGP